jgi:hemerythrin-like domain-containing protein
MNHTALSIIRDEHQALAAMLRSLLMLLDKSRKDRQPPPFDVLRAMLFYIDEFPERLHHQHESKLLFPLIRQRVPALAGTIDRLESDHVRGEASVRQLGHELLAWEVLGNSRRAAFEQSARRYVDAYLRHMALEESAILPAARDHLSQDEWRRLDSAFEADRDPLTGEPAPDEYRPLFKRIVMTAPAPIGLG